MGDSRRTEGEATQDHPVLLELLAGNDDHVDTLPRDWFSEVRDQQHPSVVSICCSDSRVPQERMWSVDRPGVVFTPSTIGNQTWDDHDGDRVVDGSLLYPIAHTGTETVAVVGHTGCGAITAAYEVATGSERPAATGIAKWVDLLVPVVEAGLESDLVDADAPESAVIDQLVEYNVDHQVRFLRDAPELPETVSIYGFVYDFHGTYGGEDGRTYLVNVDGETDPEAIASFLPEGTSHVSRSLLH